MLSSLRIPNEKKNSSWTVGFLALPLAIAEKLSLPGTVFWRHPMKTTFYPSFNEFIFSALSAVYSNLANSFH